MVAGFESAGRTDGPDEALRGASWTHSGKARRIIRYCEYRISEGANEGMPLTAALRETPARSLVMNQAL